MVSSYGRWATTSCILLLLCYAPSLVADTANENSSEDYETGRRMESVVVTATRTEESILDVAEAISVVGAEDIGRLAPELLAEMLRGVPGAFRLRRLRTWR